MKDASSSVKELALSGAGTAQTLSYEVRTRSNVHNCYCKAQINLSMSYLQDFKLFPTPS